MFWHKSTAMIDIGIDYELALTARADVQPKTYVQGSRADDTSSTSTLIVGGVAAAVAALLLVVGLTANKNNVAAGALQTHSDEDVDCEPCPPLMHSSALLDA
jgi:hypothetical protein